jgi:DNA polymerase III sliding clamp (beta) subunit (PCNA family)
MTGVYFEAPNNEEGSQSRICATDAHRLFFKPISALTESFILPKKAAKILLDLGGEWTLAGDGYFEMKDGEFVMTQPTITELHDPVFFYLNETDEDEGIWPRKGLKEDALKDYANRPDWEQEYSFERWVQREPKYPEINPDEKIKVEVPDLTRQPEKTLINSTNIRFTRADGVQVVTRVIDARFPDYRVVLPGGDGNVVVTMNPDELLKELKNAGKFANTATNQVVFSINGNVSLSSCDVDFEHEFQTGVEQAEIKWAPEVNHELKIAFNSKFLSEIVQRVKDEPVSVKFWAPHKAAIINDNFLLMPLMLNS